MTTGPKCSNTVHDEVPHKRKQIQKNNQGRICFGATQSLVLYIHTHDSRITQLPGWLLSSGRPLSDYCHPGRVELVHQERMEDDNG